MAKPAKKFQAARPDGELRQSQLVTTFGPGAIMDLIDHTVLIGGLDTWHFENGRTEIISEPRLRAALVERLKPLEIELGINAFRKPPTTEDGHARPSVGVPAMVFPTWFVCQNEQCRALVRGRSLTVKKGRLWHECEQSPKESPAVPVRFVAACRHGHLQDFPWIDYAHGRELCGTPRLKLVQDASGDVQGISARCQCGASASLGDALSMSLRCSGQRPWLGPDTHEDCEERLHLLVRTASNAYFAQVVSALSIPEPGKELQEAVDKHWMILQDASEEDISVLLKLRAVKPDLERFDPGAVLDAIRSKRRGGDNAKAPTQIRSLEYKQLVGAPPESPGDLPASEDTFFAREHTLSTYPPGISRVVLVPKLREVRAQVGFTRLEPVTPDVDGEFDLGVKTARIGLASDWLPALEIQGEGIFMQLDETAVRAWEERDAVQKRTEKLRRAHLLSAADNAGQGKFLGARYYLLHSLSHLVITAISLECGYSASAIRERIYCNPTRTDPQPMAAILLSTGTSGSEGTLGGLVDQGRHLVEHLRRAFDLGTLCSNDPICACHDPEDSAVGRYFEGAACHGCLFIAEPSCERFNRNLDRALVVPCIGHEDLAFFRVRP